MSLVGPDFAYATFDRNTTFMGTEFSSSASFAHTTFGGRAEFNGCIFAGDTDFKSAKFADRVEFLFTRFRAASKFEQVTFGRRVSFGHATAVDSIDLIGCEWSEQSEIILGHSPIALEKFTTTDLLIVDRDVSSCVGADCSEATSDPPSLSIVESTLLHPITISANARLTKGSFELTTGLDQLRFQGDPEWLRRGRRKILYDEDQGTSPERLEVLYRQFRASLEASKAAPAAADFFYGEMEARRARATHHRFASSEWWLLSIYKWIAGYGVRPWRSFACFVALVILMGLVFYGCDSVVYRFDWDRSLQESVKYSFQNSFNLFQLRTWELSFFGIVLVVFQRLASIGLLALAVIGLRSRTER